MPWSRSGCEANKQRGQLLDQMSNIFTYFTVSLPFSSRDISIAISNLLQMTTARWRHGRCSTFVHPSTYTGETKCTLGTRIKEHKEDAGKASACRPYTQSNRKTSEKEMHKSVITDHMTQQNHIVHWEGAKFVDRESDWRTRGIKEAIWIRKTKDIMNRDEGRYRLSHIYDDLKGHPGRGRGGHTPE